MSARAPQRRVRRFSEDVAGRYVAALRGGASRELAQTAVGVDAETILAWEARRPGFAVDVERALSSADPEAVVREAAATSWRAAAWMLDRKAEEDEMTRLRELTTGSQ